ncbi:MAG: vitamin K epoxide reductase family protein [Anaerolineae bacterium]|nr:vitamin K epoxide reductase family protein [Anaerolineae bacterium]
MSTLNASQSDAQVSANDARGSLLRRISLLLAVVGILITGYMTYNKLSGQVLPCTNEGIVNCSVVENSAWAYVLGVPTATWGLLAHLTILAILLFDQRIAFLRDYSVILLFGIVLFGMLYHTYLIYVSLTILQAICPWCMAAAAIMLLQLIVTGIRLRRTLSA